MMGEMVVAERARAAQAVREARDEAAPFAVAAAGLLVALGLVSRHANWDLLGRGVWWLWPVIAAPYVCLTCALVLSVARGADARSHRRLVLAALTAVWLSNVTGVLVLVGSLVASSSDGITGRELLMSGGIVWLVNTIAFALAYWELDCGGPIARLIAGQRRTPDFQFPQDENPGLAPVGWTPRLADYAYLALTNSVAFSPTDAMPLSRSAKSLMAAQSILSSITVLLIAARAVNILG